ncbi:MAG: outer membrane porin GjpA, partial [Mycobacterium sp.]
MGAGLFAVTPVAASLPALPDIQSRAVQLTAGDAWTDVFNQASTNSTQLTQNFGLAPFVGLQQSIVNQNDAMQSVLNDPSSITSVTNDMQEHLKAVMSAYTLLNADDDTVKSVLNHTINSQLDISGISGGFITAGHNLILSDIGSFLPAGTDLETITPILNFLASPASAMIMGSLGPMLSPWVALSNSISDGDSFQQILASPLDGFLNGADLNLDSLIPLVSGILPAGTTINSLDLALG